MQFLQAALLTRSITRPHDPGGSADTYGDEIRAIPTARVSWWRFGESVGEAVALDEEGTQNGLYQGSVTLGQPGLPSNTNDKSARFNGTNAYVDVTHNAAYNLSSGEITIWFRTSTLGTTNQFILDKDAASLGSGQFSIYYRGGDVSFRYQIESATAVNRALTPGGAFPTIASNTTYCASFVFGTGGMKLYLSTGGVMQLVASNSYAGGIANANNLRFAASIGTGTPDEFGAFTIDEVIIWGAQLSDADRQAVHQVGETEPPPPSGDGSYEIALTGLTPAIYLKLNETTGAVVNDSSGGNRHGTITGTPAGYRVTALPAGIGEGNLGLNLGAAASISIPHAAADVALTSAYASPWNGSQTGNRFIADATVAIWFKPNSLPSVGNKAVIVAKSSSQTPGVAASYDGSWEAYLDSNGAVHVECRSFRGRPCRVRTVNGAVVAGTRYHLAVQLSYDGVTAWLNGAKFEDGYANLLHVFGLAADILGTVHANIFAWTIGKAAWGGQADLVVDEFAVFLRTPNATINQTNVNALAEQLSTPAALAHYVWGQRSVNRSSFASINAAIDNANSLGGGTVLINPGTYNENVILKSNVRIKANGGTVNINGTVRTPYFNRGTLTPGASFANGSRSLTASNSLAAGALVRVRGVSGATITTPATLRYDRAYNTDSQSEDPAYPDGQVFEVEAPGNPLTLVGSGWQWPTITSGNQVIETIASPTQWVAMEGDIRIVSSSGSSNVGMLYILYCRNFRLVGADARNTADQGQAIRIGPDAIYGNLRNCKNRLVDVATNNVDGIQMSTSSDVVAKDCQSFDGRHACDFSVASGHNAAGSLNSVLIAFPTLRCEQHGLSWTQTGPAGGGKGTSFSAHGLNKLCMVWNSTANWGGPNINGIGMEMRWLTSGGTASGTQGEISYTDGADGCYLRDTYILRPEFWFRTPGSVVSVDRCVFRNVRRSASTSGTAHNGEYGSGDARCHYSSVDAPWTTGATAWILD